MSGPLHEQLITTIAQKLNEPDGGVIAQIRAVVAQLGPEKVAVLVRTVAQLEQLGGCLIVSGSRRRTPGGLFLVLARGCMSRAQRAAVWPVFSETPTAEAAEDKSAASTRSIETGGTTAPSKAIVTPKLKSVNMTAKGRSNDRTSIRRRADDTRAAATDL